jgi:hypothetical protein
MGCPGFISMKGAEHTGVMFLYELKKTDKSLLLLIRTKTEIGADRENGLYAIDPLQIFGANKGRREGSACISKAKMNRDRGRDTKETANPGLFWGMISHPME